MAKMALDFILWAKIGSMKLELTIPIPSKILKTWARENPSFLIIVLPVVNKTIVPITYSTGIRTITTKSINPATILKASMFLVNPIRIKSVHREHKEMKKAKPLSTLLRSVMCKMNHKEKETKSAISSKK